MTAATPATPLLDAIAQGNMANAIAREREITELRDALRALYDAFPNCDGGPQGIACRQARAVLAKHGAQSWN